MSVGIALDGGAQIFQRVGLRDHADIVFESEDLTNPDAIDRLGIRENYANGPRLDRSVNTFTVGVIVEDFHSRLPSSQPQSHCSANR